jgi:hypothetical protein
MRRILIVKPYYVTLEETKDAIDYFYARNSGTSISLLANLFPDDYQRALNSINVEEKMLYGPHAKKLTRPRLAGLCFSLQRRRFDKAFLLVGKPAQDNYRKGKLFVFFSGAKESKLYYTQSGQEAALDPFGIQQFKNQTARTLSAATKGVLELSWKTILLILISAGFVLFIVLPMKIKRPLVR